MKKFLTAASAVLCMTGALNQTALASRPPAAADVIPLWTQDYLRRELRHPMGRESVSKKGHLQHISNPRLLVYTPAHPNRKAIMVISGGGYKMEAQGTEGQPVSRWLADKAGFTVFNLIYRLPKEGWDNRDVSFADGQRALRIIRSLASKYGYEQVGVLGFSAGGHLAGMLAVSADQAFYKAQDELDSLPDRPDFAALIYPVVSFVDPPLETSTYKMVVEGADNPSRAAELSLEQRLDKQPPPMFLAHAKDDPIAPYEHSEALNDALKTRHDQHVLYLFGQGGHGWGLGKEGDCVAQWPELFKSWVDRGFKKGSEQSNPCFEEY